MAIPNINALPKYELVIPSTQQSIMYRPFLVKEQKVMLIALESRDQNSILRAITDTISACVYDKINLESLAIFDVEYIFTQIRSKSVGESSDIRLACEKCELPNPVSIKLDAITIDLSNKPPTIKLNDQFTVKMKYPAYKSVIDQGNGHDHVTFTDMIFAQVVACLDSLMTEDELIEFKNESPEAVETFVGQLFQEQFDMLANWVQEMPALKQEVTYDCKCGHHNKVTLQGLSDFFQ